MNHLTRASATLAASVAVLSFACAGFAQAPQPGPHQPPTAEQRAQWRAQRTAEHAQRLTALLNLRPDQQPALQTFLAAMTPTHQAHQRPPEGQAQAPLTTPQRLDRMADRMAKRDAAFHQRADAIRTFYAALSPEQQRAFDAMPMMMGGGHERGGHAWGHGQRPGGPMGPPQGDAG